MRKNAETYPPPMRDVIIEQPPRNKFFHPQLKNHFFISKGSSGNTQNLLFSGIFNSQCVTDLRNFYFKHV